MQKKRVSFRGLYGAIQKSMSLAVGEEGLKICHCAVAKPIVTLLGEA